MDRLLANVNVVPSCFLFPLGLPYPNMSCNKIGFDIELQINAIGIGWFLLPLPLRNRTCEFPCILLKWLWFEEARPATPIREKPWRFAHSERGTNPSRLVTASLYTSLLLAYQLERSFDRDCFLLMAVFFVTRDLSQHRQRSLDS